MSYERPVPAFEHKNLSDFFHPYGEYYFQSHSSDYVMNKIPLPSRVKPSEELAKYMKENMIYGDDSKKLNGRDYYFELILTNCGSYDLYIKYNSIIGSRLIGEGLTGLGGRFEFNGEVLLKAVKIALKNNYKVYTFDTPHGTIKQVFIVRKNVDICTVEESRLGGANIGTMHKPCSHAGTGLGIECDMYDISKHQIDNAFNGRPSWANNYSITKWKDWDEYTKRENILDYYEIG